MSEQVQELTPATTVPDGWGKEGRVHMVKQGRFPGTVVLACCGRTMQFSMPGVLEDATWCARCFTKYVR